jgi:hypothetical protein
LGQAQAYGKVSGISKEAVKRNVNKEDMCQQDTSFHAGLVVNFVFQESYASIAAIKNIGRGGILLAGCVVSECSLDPVGSEYPSC